MTAQRDALLILSHKQVIDATTYSTAAIDKKFLADYGVGRPVYARITAGGNFTTSMRVQILGFDNTDFTGIPVILADSGLLTTTQLVAGFERYLQIQQMDAKWRVLCARYIPTVPGESGETSEEVASGGIDNPSLVGLGGVEMAGRPDEENPEPEAVANSISCALVLSNRTNVLYGYKNADKETAG